LALGYFSNNDLGLAFSLENLFQSSWAKAAAGSFFAAALFIVSGVFIGKKSDSRIKEKMSHQSQSRMK
ncbi:MAG: hypothetical protein PHV17_08565, partial [Candidatus Omnitrophica bacterium]|nr:hypothetical protein [Candidatus Omnitrophota bacterium]